MAIHDFEKHRKRKQEEQARIEQQMRAEKRKQVWRDPKMKSVYIVLIVLVVVVAGLYLKPASQKAQNMGSVNHSSHTDSQN